MWKSGTGQGWIIKPLQGARVCFCREEGRQRRGGGRSKSNLGDRSKQCCVREIGAEQADVNKKKEKCVLWTRLWQQNRKKTAVKILLIQNRKWDCFTKSSSESKGKHIHIEKWKWVTQKNQNKVSESDKMPAESFSLCVDCIQQKSQEELELSRRSRQIDRFWSKIFSEFKVNLCTFNKILELISSAAWFSFAIQLFRDLKREERLIRRQVYNW